MQLNLPTYTFRIKKKDEKYTIYDSLRRKYVPLTPEEWVRQNFVSFLINERKFPQGLIANEQKVMINNQPKRCDTIVYDNHSEPLMVVEYKSPYVEITQEVFDQIAVYNTELKVKYLIVTNGLVHICCKINLVDNTYIYLPKIPDYIELN